MSYLVLNMHFALVQSFKFNIVKCSSVRVYSTKQNIKSLKNHYDTLKITPYATQNEVKSAYYKLTLQYHPDKNKSEYAKQKFQDISEAYEVLSNHELRKNYDRRMMVYQRPMSSSEESRSQYKGKIYSGTSKIYNFDAWTQAHYGKQIRLSRKRKEMYKEYIKMEKAKSDDKDEPLYVEYSLLLLTMTLLAWYFQQEVDVPASKKHKAENKKNSD